MEKHKIFEILLKEIELIVEEKVSLLHKLQSICKLLKDKVKYYDWVGFYLVDQQNPHELILGPFEGAPTEHTKIPFGKGVCGQAAEKEKTYVVQDVQKESNYLSCSIDVKSEIVVPIKKDDTIVGELDIDSHATAPFREEDRIFLEKIAEKIGAQLPE